MYQVPSWVFVGFWLGSFFTKWRVFSCFLGKVLQTNGGNGVALGAIENFRNRAGSVYIAEISFFLNHLIDQSLQRMCSLMGIPTDKMDFYLTLSIT